MLFAGTTEGRLLYEFLKEEQKEALAYVATEYGENILCTENKLAADRMQDDRVQVITGRLDKIGMDAAMKQEIPEVVIDATHPYAEMVTENIKSACIQNKIPYIRVLRESLAADNTICMQGMDEVISYLNCRQGNVLVTTGSKEIHLFTQVENYKERIFARILPDAANIQKCIDLGIQGRNLICMQGPFSEKLNYAILKEFQIQTMITKESGNQGGFLEKINAAKRAKVKVLVLERPQIEMGYRLEKVKNIIKQGDYSSIVLLV